MGYKGRVFSIGVVILFNVMRYFYYHSYYGLPFEANFFILTTVFLFVAWWTGKQYDKAKYYSEKDPLTDTYNRRTINRRFQKPTTRDKKMILVMIDLDNFKEINDTHGHQAGDDLLVEIAQLLKRLSSGRDDCIARWGGDEFLLLVGNPDQNFKSTFTHSLLAELQNIKALEYTSFGASIGFATFPDDGQTLEQLIQKADSEMYKMKESKPVQRTSR
ncbi:GGDEF domain-containing protein [Halalkalibacter krulwichiae]|uniref:Cyclic di-GMP phosphodiesterase Gmr n=1 Tax=Halalkalibacter krulwichiae TaxID=199441 RepID=A0A1X9MFK3_9BACI|nr:GGDEF domain-containing protein [Halalkalibacter krulwichiae]ARK32229.1 Cyclic di-GMP phosphodiesterase Gmr [Halalkalibacter krulwichiae]